MRIVGAVAWSMRPAGAVLFVAGLIGPAAAAEQASAAATLSVLTSPVERHAGGAGSAEPAVDGMNLAEGDRIKTGPNGVALITFLNGTTVTVLSDTEVTVKQTGEGRGQSGGMRLLIHAGRVWALVVQALGRRSSLSLESNEYTATAHDGLIGAEQASEGFVCWSRRGELRLTDRGRFTDVVVAAGRKARAHHGLPVTPEPFLPSASVIEIRTSGPVAPLLRMPDGRMAVGFLAGDVEVNQVFGSLTERVRRDRWLVEVPGGQPGSYMLVLSATGVGPFTARISARYTGRLVYERELSGAVHAGDRLSARFTHDVSGAEARSARALRATFEGLQPWTGDEPVAVVARPAAARGDVN